MDVGVVNEHAAYGFEPFLQTSPVVNQYRSRTVRTSLECPCVFVTTHARNNRNGLTEFSPAPRSFLRLGPSAQWKPGEDRRATVDHPFPEIAAVRHPIKVFVESRGARQPWPHRSWVLFRRRSAGEAHHAGIKIHKYTVQVHKETIHEQRVARWQGPRQRLTTVRERGGRIEAGEPAAQG